MAKNVIRTAMRITSASFGHSMIRASLFRS
jgi:hypothetical protein